MTPAKVRLPIELKFILQLEIVANSIRFFIQNSISDNKPVLHIQHKGYLFFKHYKTGSKTYWRCTQLVGHRKRCSARLVTSTAANDHVVEKGHHEHGKPHSVPT